jgi:hypothetical protein
MEEKVIDDVQKAQEELENVTGVHYTEVAIPGTNKKYKVRTLKNTQIEDLTKLLAGKEADPADAIIEDSKIGCKAMAIYLTQGYWKRKLTYWFKWRWYYYIRQYDCYQVQPVISAGRNSTPYIDFLRTMSLLNYQKTTMMQMTRQEAEKVLQEMAERANKESGDGKEGE